VLIPRQNRLLPILAAGVVLMLVLVLSRACSQPDEDGVVLESVPESAPPDADSPAATIRTLTAKVTAMTAELKALRTENAELKTGNDRLLESRDALETRITTRIDNELATRTERHETAQADALALLNQRIDALSEAVAARPARAPADELPVGLGLTESEPPTALKWIEPLDQSESGLGDDLLKRVAEPGSGPAGRDDTTRRSPATDDASRPVYTVPRNATLMGATAMTALLGRVPVRGEVRDPMPFKVITGRDNLAANGLTVPGVEGMIWSGTAVGDWTLSCVTGRLTSVTFVFDDGRIRTVSSDERGNSSGNNDRPLGWISDARGIPCVSGERKSNAAAFLTQRIGAKAIEAAADAAAAAQTSTVVSGSGAVTSSVPGDTGAYVLGETLAEGSSEIAKWLIERQAQSFDAVFVPAGAELALHVDQQIAIDIDPNGRRLSHETSEPRDRHHRLD
jgi:integrating conjugative element protein (TIGR03752 family)